jgi:hypothetical protein
LVPIWREQRFALVVSADFLTELLDAIADSYFRRQLILEQISASQLLLQEAMPPTFTECGQTTRLRKRAP